MSLRSLVRPMRAACCLALLGFVALRADDAPPPNLATASLSELGHPLVRAFDPQPAGAAVQFWSATEDDQGIACFANSHGAVTFDGATWRLIRAERFSPVTRAVAHGADGRLYVGSQGDLGWLRPHPDGSYEHVSLLDELPEPARDFQEVFQILAAGDATYFSCGTRLLIRRAGRFTQLPHAAARLDVVAGTVYVQSPNQPLERVDGDRLVRVSDDPVFLHDICRYIGPAADGQLLIATGASGLFHCDPATGRLAKWPTAIDALLAQKPLYRALRLADGSLALAFTALSGGGLALLGADGSFLNYLDAKNGLPNGIVYGLAASRSGGLWLCLDYGVAYLDWPAAPTVFDRTSGLERSITSAILRHRGTLYVGNTNGLHRLVPAQPPQTAARFERVLTGGVFGLHAEGDDLFALNDRRIVRLDAAGPTTVAELPVIGYALHRSSRDPALRWVGLANGLHALRVAPDGWRDEGAVPGLTGMVRTLVERPDGDLWAAIDSQGFFRVKLTAPPGAASVAATATVERFPVLDEDTARRRRFRVGLWRDEPYFTIGGSPRFLRFDEATRTFSPHPDLPELPASESINAVSQAAQSRDAFWYLTIATDDREGLASRGVHQVADRVSRPLAHRVFDAVDETAIIYDDPATGALWLGGSKAVLRVDTARAFVPLPPLHVLLRGLGVAGGETLPYARNALGFTFSSPVAPTATPPEFQSRLTGFDSAWSAWSPELKRTFTNLSEGRYRFEVRAKNLDGAVSESAVLEFRILPPWWRTVWAGAGYALLFAGALVGFARLRNRALRRKNARLEQLVAARTDDLRRQNTELARLHQLELDEKISARLAAEKAQLDALRYQLNPHFLFNSLTSIRSQIPPALGSARDTLDRLADFCRLTLHGRQPDERTTVGEELAMLRSYLDIEQTRMGELLSVAFDVDPSLDAVPMPRLLLLPLVENALKYGQATSVDTLGLKISAQRGSDAATIVFEIANTGEWVERGTRPGIPSTGIGHDNLRERLRRHYPVAHAFTHSAAAGWVTVRLVLALSGPGSAPAR